MFRIGRNDYDVKLDEDIRPVVYALLRVEKTRSAKEASARYATFMIIVGLSGFASQAINMPLAAVRDEEECLDELIEKAVCDGRLEKTR